MSTPPSSGPPPSSLPLGIDLSATHDGLFYGFVLSTAFLGISVVQGWLYLNNNNDKWPLRTVVFLLLAMDFATTVLSTQAFHHYAIANFGNLELIQRVTPSLDIEFCVSIVVVLVVEVFFASRILQLNPGKYIVPGLTVLTAVLAAIFSTVGAVELFKNATPAGFAEKNIEIQVTLSNGLSAISDILATVSLSVSFFKAKTGIKRTDTILQSLFLFVVTRGVLVTVVQLLILILYVAGPSKLWWLPLHLLVTKVYAITMLSMLNARPALRKTRALVTDSDMSTGRVTATAVQGTTLELQNISKLDNEPRKMMITREKFVSVV